MNETLTRVLTALVIGPLSLYMLHLGGWFWAGYVSLVAVICQLEFFSIMEAKGFRPHRRITLAITVALLVVAYAAGVQFGAAMLTAGILALLVVQLSRPTIGTAINNVSVSLAGVLYIGWLLSHGIYLREMVEPGTGVAIGEFFVVFAMVCTFLSDTGAYFAGRALGRHKVAPTVSPGKTWEGLVGGLLTAGAGGMLLKFLTELWFYPIPYDHALLFGFGLLIGLVGFFGDLVESLLKRDADVKDSGSLLPGHGGLLDRIDGILFSVPFAYYGFLALQRLVG